MNPKKIGIIGGMGSRAGLMLFQRIIEHSPAVRDQDFPEIVLHSNTKVPDRTRAIVYGEISPVTELLRSVELMNANDVDYILMACVTAHYYYPVLQQASRSTILHPAKVAVEHYLQHYAPSKKLGLLCTTGAMQGRIFQTVCNEHDVTLVTLSDREQEALFMRSVYMEGGLKSAMVSKEALRYFSQAVESLASRGAEVFLGGCSEIQIALADTTVGIPCIDAFDVLAKKAVQLCYQQDKQLSVA